GIPPAEPHRQTPGSRTAKSPPQSDWWLSHPGGSRPLLGQRFLSEWKPPHPKAGSAPDQSPARLGRRQPDQNRSSENLPEPLDKLFPLFDGPAKTAESVAEPEDSELGQPATCPAPESCAPDFQSASSRSSADESRPLSTTHSSIPEPEP